MPAQQPTAQRPTEVLGEEIATIAVQVTTATHRFLTLLREFDVRAGWLQQGLLSCAHWLSWRIGMEPVTAREHVRVANKLGALPKIDEQMKLGRLSYSKVRALTRIATPETEEELIEMAKHTTAAQLQIILGKYRHWDAMNAKDRFDHQIEEDARYFRHTTLATGMVKIEALLHAEEAELVLRAIEAARFSAPRPEPVEPPAASASAEACTAPKSDEEFLEDLRRQSRELDSAMQRNEEDASAEAPQVFGLQSAKKAIQEKADALVRVAESFLAGGPVERTAGARVEMVVHVDANVLAKTQQQGECELGSGAAIAAETARRLACDCSFYSILHGADGKSLSVGRKTRSVPTSIRRALEARCGRTCSFPGCTHQAFIDAHHVQHWALGGETKLSNLILLCRRHHRLVHEEGYTVELNDNGDPTFHTALGAKLDTVPELPPQGRDAYRALIEHESEEDLEIDPFSLTAVGDLMVNYDMAVSAVIAMNERADARRASGMMNGCIAGPSTATMN